MLSTYNHKYHDFNKKKSTQLKHRSEATFMFHIFIVLAFLLAAIFQFMLIHSDGGCKSDCDTSFFSADVFKRPQHLVCYTCGSVVSVCPVHPLVHLTAVCCGCNSPTQGHL